MQVDETYTATDGTVPVDETYAVADGTVQPYDAYPAADGSVPVDERYAHPDGTTHAAETYAVMLEPLVPTAPPRGRAAPIATFLFLGLFMLTVLALVAGLVYVANYQPLERSWAGWKGNDCIDERGDVMLLDRRSVTLARATCFEPGDVLSWGFSLENKGRIPIYLRDMHVVRMSPFKALELWTYDLADLRCSGPLPCPERDPNDVGTLERFRPVTLEPGDARFFVYRATMGTCAPGSGLRIVGQTVTYDVMGIERVEELPAPTQVDVRCPSR